MATTTTERDQTTRVTSAERPAAEERRIEDRRDRVVLAREAGWRRISWASVVAGVFVAYGAFAVLLGIVSAVLDAIGVDTTGLSDADWRGVGVGSAAALCVVLLVTYFYGGYVAGRMARRSGFLQGLCVFLVGFAVLAAAAGIVIALDGTAAIRDRLHDLGAPTSGDKWVDIGSAAGISGLLVMFFGAVLGGVRGERWHQRLLERAADPTYGPSTDAAAPVATGETRDEEPLDGADDEPRVVWSQAPPTPVVTAPERRERREEDAPPVYEAKGSKVEPTEPEAEKPEAEKPDADQPAADQPAAEQPDAEKPAGAQADADRRS